MNDPMKPSMGIMAGKGSPESGVGKETCTTGTELTIEWIVS